MSGIAINVSGITIDVSGITFNCLELLSMYNLWWFGCKNTSLKHFRIVYWDVLRSKLAFLRDC